MSGDIGVPRLIRRIVLILSLTFLIIAKVMSLGESQVFSESWTPQEKWVRDSVTDLIGPTTNRVMPYIKDVKCENGHWSIQLNADRQPDATLLKGNVLFKSGTIVENFFREREDLKTLSVEWYYPLKISEEVSEDIPIIKFSFSRSKVDGIDWRFDRATDLVWLADSYREYPAWSSKVDHGI